MEWSDGWLIGWKLISLGEVFSGVANIKSSQYMFLKIICERPGKCNYYMMKVRCFYLLTKNYDLKRSK